MTIKGVGFQPAPFLAFLANAHDSHPNLCYAPRFISGTMLKSAANRLYQANHDPFLRSHH